MDNEKFEQKMQQIEIEIATIKQGLKQIDGLVEKMTELMLVVRELVIRMDNTEKTNGVQDNKLNKILYSVVSVCFAIISFLIGRQVM